MEDEICIRIQNDASVSVSLTQGGIVATKQIAPDALTECIRKSLRGGVPIFSGLLPEHVLSVTFHTEDKSYDVAMEYPDKTADITYMETTYPDFPLPRMVFGFCVQDGGRISAVRLGVPADEKLTEDTQLFQFPFSNVHGFSLCTGANVLPKIKSLRSLTNLPHFLLALPDNDDYYNDRSNQLQLSHRDLLEHLCGKNRAYYYSDILVPMNGTRLKDFLQGRNPV